MDWRPLPEILDAEQLVERALHRAAKKRSGASDNAARKLSSLSDNLAATLGAIVDDFPSLDQLHPFDRDIVDLSVGLDELRQSLGGVDWARKQLQKLGGRFTSQAARARGERARQLQKQGYGRLTSVVRQIADRLEFLRDARSVLRKLPAVDPETPLVAMAGAPNVGKSSLVRAISTGRPVVREYPFTTKSVSLGHITARYQTIQVLDTPGLLDRPDAERNNIEKQGLAALEHLAPAIVFVTDASGTSGYPLEVQQALRAELRARYPQAPWLEVHGKFDLEQEAPPGEGALAVSATEGTGVDELKQAVITMLLPG